MHTDTDTDTDAGKDKDRDTHLALEHPACMYVRMLYVYVCIIRYALSLYVCVCVYACMHIFMSHDDGCIMYAHMNP